MIQPKDDEPVNPVAGAIADVILASMVGKGLPLPPVCAEHGVRAILIDGLKIVIGWSDGTESVIAMARKLIDQPVEIKALDPLPANPNEERIVAAKLAVEDYFKPAMQMHLERQRQTALQISARRLRELLR